MADMLVHSNIASEAGVEAVPGARNSYLSVAIYTTSSVY